ncbi:MAG: DUF6502 family protein [Emcibacteraceae bacterium]|nr:DUF6502 family protein [Emcibacteraceae bacterium]
MSNNDDIGKQDGLIIRAITNVMRPLVKFLIGRGITLPMFTEILKHVYVEVAANDYKLSPDKDVTDSRITLLTKVHRKDVRRIRTEQMGFDVPQDGVDVSDKKSSLGAQIVSKWLADNRYTDDGGEPIALHIHKSKAGSAESFEGLVESINNDIRPRVALDNMMMQKMIVETEEGIVTLNKSAFIPEENFEELMGHFDRNLHDHMAAAVHNIAQDKTGKKFMERSVYYKELTQGSIEKLEKLIEDQGMENLISINKAAYDMAEDDADAGNNDQRMTFGIYYYSDKDEE